MRAAVISKAFRRGTPRRTEDPPALPPALRTPVAIIGVVAVLVLAALAALFAGQHAPSRLDTWGQTAVHSLLPEPGTGALVIDFVGEPLGAALLVALLTAVCLALGRWRLGIVAVTGLCVVAVVSTALKSVVGRTINGDYLSYPSGHTATATFFGLIVMLLVVDLLRVATLPAMLLILSGSGVAGLGMALAQVALGAHYPTDTVGGFCMAVSVASATTYTIDQLPGRRLAG